MIIDADVYLEHHGVKGMKWGVRKQEDTTSSQSRSNTAGTLPVDPATLAFMGVKMTLMMHSRGAFASAKQRGQLFVTGHLWEKNSEYSKTKMSQDEIIKKVVPGINPDYGKRLGATMNCRRATFTYEMRRRGYDVQATKTLTAAGQDASGLFNATHPGHQRIKSGVFGMTSEIIGERVSKGLHLRRDTPFNNLVKSEKYMFSTGRERRIAITQKATHDDIFKALSKQPNRSRGELMVKWTAGGAHSVAYEIINKKPVIFDTQRRIYAKNAKELQRVLPHPMKDAGFTRLDNKKLNQTFLMRWMTASKKPKPQK